MKQIIPLTLLLGALSLSARAAVTIDVRVSIDGTSKKSTIASPAFSTHSSNELLLAFVSTDYVSGSNTTVTGMSGGGLVWALVIRTNAQRGTAEIWRAFAASPLANVIATAALSQSVVASITVMSFAGVDTSGANGSGAIGAVSSGSASSGAPTATLTTTRGGSWVFGVGNDWDNAIARTPGAGQSLVHQNLSPKGDTYWVQMQNASTPLSGTSVIINDTAPTTDRYNLSICEVLPASSGGTQTWSISGAISPSSIASGTTVTLSGASSAMVTADNSGNYSFNGLSNGSYTVTPSKSGLSFSPVNQTASISGANVANINFTAQTSSGSSIAIDATISSDQATANSTVTTSAFSTHAGNELLLAFVSTDYLSGANTTVTSVTSAGLTWALVARTNVQSGTSEIWRAFAPSALSSITVTATLSQSAISSITVMTFTGVDTSGTNGSGAIGATGSGNASSGAPIATLVTTRNNSWVIGVGNDFDNAIARSPGAGQTLVHQYLTPTGDTYWTQRQLSPTASSGTTVSISDTAPTTDRYNFSICEVLPALGVADTTPPSVSILAPVGGSTVTSISTVSATASDESGVAGLQFLLDSVNLGTEITTSPYSTTWDTTKVANGSHILTARARDSAGLTATSNAVAITVDNSGNPAIVGSWSSVVSLPTVAVNLILLKNGKVLLYEDGTSPTVWDYANNTFTNVPTQANLFCSGHAALADGRVLVVGGYGGGSTSIGIASSEIFDPATNTWTINAPNMAYKRWYPTATLLSDRRVLVTAGWQTAAHTNAGIPEIYDPATNKWTSLTNANNPFETYPFMHLLPDGRVIHVGGTEYPTVTDILDLNTQTWSVVDSNIVDGGSSVMYLPGKIIKAGSSADSQNSGPSSNTTYVLDMTEPSPAWRATSPMAYARSFLNLVTLPDGNVVAIGGETDKNGGNIANAVYAAEMWSPRSETWTTMASMHTPREYHATALLLPDARVLVSGMGADFGNVTDETNAEFYSPPYLFKGARPTITQAPAQLQYGTSFFVGTPDASNIASVVIIRTGAVTHFFDQSTRYVPLSFQQTIGGLNITAPANSMLAPPGYYMLFIVNGSGVPSVAPFIQLP
jgi:hypothetical protein